MISWIVIVVGLLICTSGIDLDSTSKVESVFYPIMTAIFGMAFFIRSMITLAALSESVQYDEMSKKFNGFGGDGGCGGGDGGC